MKKLLLLLGNSQTDTAYQASVFRASQAIFFASLKKGRCTTTNETVNGNAVDFSLPKLWYNLELVKCLSEREGERRKEGRKGGKNNRRKEGGREEGKKTERKEGRALKMSLLDT